MIVIIKDKNGLPLNEFDMVKWGSNLYSLVYQNGCIQLKNYSYSNDEDYVYTLIPITNLQFKDDGVTCMELTKIEEIIKRNKKYE